MTPRYGSLSVLDTLAKYNNTSVTEFGEGEMAGFIQDILDVHEAFIAEIVGEFAGNVPDRETTWGVTTSDMEMLDLDEFGIADAQKIPWTPASTGFPLRRIGASLQWTQDYLDNTSPAEMALQVLAITDADTSRWYRDLRRTLLNAVNNTGYIDRLTDQKTLTLRALLNADSQVIPPHPITGTFFDPATHTHFLATAALIEANLVNLTETVREHGVPAGATIRVYINQASETAVRAFTGFKPYTDSRIIYGTAADRTDQNVNLMDLEDRAIGIHGPAEIWVKPWVPTNYMIAHMVGAGESPVLGIRLPDGPKAQYAQLRIVADYDRFPLHARAYQRIRGLSVWNRHRAAVLYTGGGTYVSYTGV